LGYAQLFIYINNYVKHIAGTDLSKTPKDYLKEYSDLMNYERNRLPVSASGFTKPERPLPCAISLCRFFREEESRLETYYAVPWNELYTEETPDGRKSEITLNYAVRDSAFNLLSHKTQNTKILLPAGVPMNDQIHIGQINESLKPGTYYFSMEIKNSKADKAVEKTYKVIIPELSDRLLLSDIQLASDITSGENQPVSSPFVKNNLYIIPHPFTSISKKKPVYIYFEVSNLFFNDSGFTAYTVEYEVKAKRTGLNPFARKKRVLSSSYQRNGNKRDEAEYFALDAGKLAPGDYSLKIKVTDETGRTSQTSEINLEVVE
jgi:hypothetical protein